METSLKKVNVVEVLNPQKYRNRVYRLEGADIPERENVILDFSALPESIRQKELVKFHNINDDGSVTVRIHRCKSVKRFGSPELIGNERYACEAKQANFRDGLPNACSRCGR